jgi:hypothetical protein
MNFKDEVKINTEIVDYIGEYTNFEQDAAEWMKGRCPFCEAGKILVNRDEQVFKSPCCDKKGDVFTFAQFIMNVSFTEAVIHLANRAKMKIPKKILSKATNGNTSMDSKPKRKIFGFFKRSIPYFKELRKIAGSATASILMSQLEYWFEDNPEGFYKFLEPPPEGHPAYNPGDSWCEELAFSKEEFRTAFDRIGIRYASKTQFFSANPEDIFISNRGDEKFYCSYFDKVRGTTHYFRNLKTDTLIDELLKDSGNKQSQFPKIRHKKRQKV